VKFTHLIIPVSLSFPKFIGLNMWCDDIYCRDDKS
jgi:hypothetical protein